MVYTFLTLCADEEYAQDWKKVSHAVYQKDSNLENQRTD
jgi:hypothetical protein